MVITTAPIDMNMHLHLLSQICAVGCRKVGKTLGNPIFILGRASVIVWHPSLKSTHSFSATLIEQGSVLDHLHRNGACPGSYTLMLAMIGSILSCLLS